MCVQSATGICFSVRRALTSRSCQVWNPSIQNCSIYGSCDLLNDACPKTIDFGGTSIRLAAFEEHSRNQVDVTTKSDLALLSGACGTVNHVRVDAFKIGLEASG